jgi:hypothetical protein
VLVKAQKIGGTGTITGTGGGEQVSEKVVLKKDVIIILLRIHTKFI